MKIIESENIIYLDNKDQLIIKNSEETATIIKCLNGILTIDDISLNQIKNKANSPEQIALLKKIITNKKNNIQIRTLFHNPRKIILNKNETIFINEYFFLFFFYFI